MKYHLLAPLFCLALVSCAHQRSGRQCGGAENEPRTHGALESQRISPSWGDPLRIDPAKPPEGMHLIQILLENQSLPVKGTNCEGSALGSGDKRRLQHKLARLLGSGLDNARHRTELSAICQTDKYELPSGGIIDAWHCSLTAVENDENGERIASSSIDFGITKDTWEFVPVPKALVCI